MDALDDLARRDGLACRDDLARRDDHPDAPALRTGGDPAREYGYRRFRATARKTGNLLRHLGVRDGATVAVADDPAPEAVFALLGTALLGGSVRFLPSGDGGRVGQRRDDDRSDPSRDVEARALVAPTDRLEEFALPPGGQRVGYGTEPVDPSVNYFERDVWSENPGFPPTTVDPGSAVLAVGDGRTLSHEDVLAAARGVAADLDSDDVVAVRASLSEPGTVAAGVVAPLLAGACVLLSGEDSGVSDGNEPTGTVAVVPGGDADVPEGYRVVASEQL